MAWANDPVQYRNVGGVTYADWGVGGKFAPGTYAYRQVAGVTPSGAYLGPTNPNLDAGMFAWVPVGAGPATPNVSASTGVNPTETAYSLYGHNIPLSVFGVGRIGGEIISGPWVDGSTASFIISFGVPADPGGSRDLREIAFDSEVVWTNSGGFSTEPFTYRFYGGTLTQAADPLETTHFGADAVAYRPQILLAFERLPLGNTKFRKIPYVAALFGDSTGDDVNLGEAFERLAYSPWVGWTSDRFETVGITDGLVHGGLIITQQAEFLATIQQFGRFYPNWDILQTDKLRISDRGANVTADIVLDRTTLKDAVSFSRGEPNSVARELELTTIDPDADYTLVPSTARRPHDPVNVTSSVRVDTAFLPAIMDASVRQSIVTYALYHEEQAREKFSCTAMMFGLEVEPGDLIAVTSLGEDFSDQVLKVTSTTHGANYAVEIVAEAILNCQTAAPAVNHLDCVNAFVSELTPWTSHSFTGINFGPAFAFRHIVVGLNLSMTATGQSVTSVTIGGVAATAVTTASNTGQGLISTIWSALVPSGTFGNIDVVCSGGFFEISAHVYRIVSSAYAVHDTAATEATTASPVIIAVDVAANGVVIAVGAERIGAQFTWAGADPDCTFINVPDNTGARSSAMYTSVLAVANHAISFDPVSIDRVTLVAASFEV